MWCQGLQGRKQVGVELLRVGGRAGGAGRPDRRRPGRGGPVRGAVRRRLHVRPGEPPVDEGGGARAARAGRALGVQHPGAHDQRGRRAAGGHRGVPGGAAAPDG